MFLKVDPSGKHAFPLDTSTVDNWNARAHYWVEILHIGSLRRHTDEDNGKDCLPIKSSIRD